MKTVDDKAFQALANAHGYAAVDAGACGGDFGSADRFAAAEEALAAYVDAQLETVRAAAAKQINDALALQHERITRMENALIEIGRAAQHAGKTPLTLSAIADLAAVGLIK